MSRRRVRTGMRAILGVVALSLLLLAGMPTAGGTGSPSGNPQQDALIRRQGRWFVDTRGRVVDMRGVNFVQKFPPIAPEAVGFGDDDAAFLAREGFNLVRLGVVFGSVMPQPGAIDDAYVAAIARTTHVLARHHIYVLLDFHQDGYGPLVHGNGFPEWATLTDGLPNPDVGFPGYYISNPALQRAFDNFWNNAKGPDGVRLQQHYGEALRSVASAVAAEPYVLGYDLMNEPWPGTDWSSCVTGCPGIERARLLPFEKRMSDAIRSVDRKHLLFSEPFVLFNFGRTDTVVPAAGTRGGALSFHVYAASPADEPGVVLHALAAGLARNAPLLASEYGATTDPATITRIASTIETGLIPWAFWSYDENFVIDKALPPTADNVRQLVLDALARPYAAATDGTPTTWAYDPATGELHFSYSTTRIAPNHTTHNRDTEIAIGTRAYPGGYRVDVTGGHVVSAPCASRIRIHNDRNAKVVTVHVERAPCQPAAHAG
ncbi:MAG: endoglycoceramidase [Actinomycetia bacterium]|nr:endoglycoceramidase [Actinomycetes bacterium]